jgi:hypothetical protein
MRFVRRRRPAGDAGRVGAPAGREVYQPEVLAALVGWEAEMREWYLGQRPEPPAAAGFGVLAEAAVWCRFLGDARAETAFRAAAQASGPPWFHRPARATAMRGMCLSLAGDADAAQRAWREGADELVPRLEEVTGAVEPAQLWRAWRDGSTVDPAAQGLNCIELAYCRLRCGDGPAAGHLLDIEQGLRSAATAQDARYYHDLSKFDAPLVAVIRRLLDPPDRDAGLVTQLRRYVRCSFPERLGVVLDLQQAYPDRVPPILPPANLEDALLGNAKRRLAALREGRPLP